MPERITRNVITSPLLVDPAMPRDPDLRAVAEDVLAKMKYSFAVAAADPQPSSSREDNLFRSYLASRSPATRKRYQEQSLALLAAPEPMRVREFRRYAAINPQEYRALDSDKITMRVGKLDLKPKAVKMALQKIANIYSIPLPELPEPNPDLKAGLEFKKMRLFIERVRCIVETDEVGSDEINIGGNATDPFGNTSLIDQFVVSEDFDEDEEVEFGRSKVFHTWNLETKNEGFPYAYSAVIVLAEKDDGGFGKFLQELWQKVESQVKQAVSTAIGAAIGGAIGGAIGLICGTIVGALIGWIINIFDNADDIIGAKPVEMMLGAATRSYYDWAKLTSPQGLAETLIFKGDGGKYKVDIAWRVFTQ